MIDLLFLDKLGELEHEFFEIHFSNLQGESDTKFFVKAFQTYTFLYKKLDAISTKIEDGEVVSDLETVNTIQQLSCADTFYMQFKEAIFKSKKRFDVMGTYKLGGIEYNLDSDLGPEYQELKRIAEDIIDSNPNAPLELEKACLALSVEECYFL